MDNLPEMSKIRVKQIRSGINREKSQKATLIALGLRKMNQVVEHESTPQIEGMIKKVQHLVEVEKA
jgi:large subunit ribosomal protein L30